MSYLIEDRINFNNPTVGKPSNLQNSAVLRMLEEEEQRQRSGQSPSLKRVAWPPPNEGGENYTEEAPVQSQGGPQYSSQSPTLQNNYTPAQQVPQNPSQRNPLKPLDISNGTNYPQSSSSSSPLVNPSPLGYRPAPDSKRWAPVHSPTQYQAPPSQQYQAPAPPQQYQTSFSQQYQAPSSQQYQPLPQQYQQQKNFSQQTSQPSVAATNQAAQIGRQVEPPPATITLRPQAPVSQAPPPVVTSQPATATLKGGKNLRGDLKWPPEIVKRQFEEENRQRVELARGPAVKPRLVRKDYGPFFAQHALNASYPGYKAPPGTQFYDHKEVY